MPDPRLNPTDAGERLEPYPWAQRLAMAMAGGLSGSIADLHPLSIPGAQEIG